MDYEWPQLKKKGLKALYTKPEPGRDQQPEHVGTRLLVEIAVDKI